jgi:hypothetical protein
LKGIDSFSISLTLSLWLSLGVCATAQQTVQVSFSQHPSSSWRLELDPEGRRVVAYSRELQGIAVEMDYDGATDDGHLEGITAILGELRLEGRFWGAVAPLIYPMLDPEEHRLERLEVEAEGQTLRVRFEGGSYRILSAAGGEQPLFTEAVFRLEPEEMIVDLNGLYYLLPSQGGTRVAVIDEAGQERVLRVDQGTDSGTTIVADEKGHTQIVSEADGHYLEYFERVTGVEIEDARFGRLVLTTYAQRLQVQVDRPAAKPTDLFELDFDHAFKDRGQRQVLSQLVISLPPATVSD